MLAASYFHARGRRSTDSRVTRKPTSSANRSRRFDFAGCRLLSAVACGAVASALLANACQSFATSDDLSMILFGVSSMPFGALCGWFLAPANPMAEIDEAAELAERTRRWSEAAERMQVLKAERARLRQSKKSCAAVDAEMRALTTAMLAGEV